MEYFSKDKPFLNFNEMIWHFDCLLINCDVDIELENVKRVSSVLKEAEIYNICHRAKQEIQNQVFVQNNNTKALIKWTNDKLTGIESRINKIIADNELNHIDKMPKYYLFFEVTRSFWDFYNWFFIEVYPLYTGNSKPENKPKKIRSPVIALFCSLLNDSKVKKRGVEETIADYCERVCIEYKLPYSDRVRQGFSSIGTKTNKQKVKELILPLINAETAALITKHLENLK